MSINPTLRLMTTPLRSHLLTRVPQLEEKAKKVSEERRFFAEGAYEGNASFRAM